MVFPFAALLLIVGGGVVILRRLRTQNAPPLELDDMPGHPEIDARRLPVDERFDDIAERLLDCPVDPQLADVVEELGWMR